MGKKTSINRNFISKITMIIINHNIDRITWAYTGSLFTHYKVLNPLISHLFRGMGQRIKRDWGIKDKRLNLYFSSQPGRVIMLFYLSIYQVHGFNINFSTFPQQILHLSAKALQNGMVNFRRKWLFPVQTTRLSRLSICLLPSISYSIWLLMYWEEKIQK